MLAFTFSFFSSSSSFSCFHSFLFFHILFFSFFFAHSFFFVFLFFIIIIYMFSFPFFTFSSLFFGPGQNQGLIVVHLYLSFIESKRRVKIKTLILFGWFFIKLQHENEESLEKKLMYQLNKELWVQRQSKEMSLMKQKIIWLWVLWNIN